MIGPELTWPQAIVITAFFSFLAVMALSDVMENDCPPPSAVTAKQHGR